MRIAVQLRGHRRTSPAARTAGSRSRAPRVPEGYRAGLRLAARSWLDPRQHATSRRYLVDQHERHDLSRLAQMTRSKAASSYRPREGESPDQAAGCRVRAGRADAALYCLEAGQGPPGLCRRDPGRWMAGEGQITLLHPGYRRMTMRAMSSAAPSATSRRANSASAS